MTTTTSSSNKRNTIIGQCFYRLKGFVLLYSVLLFICVPLSTVLNFDKIALVTNPQLLKGSRAEIDQIFDMFTLFDFLGEIFVAAVIPVFMVIFIFKYMHNKVAVDFYHSLPISRTSLLFCNFLCGYTAIVVPFFINYFLKVAFLYAKVGKFSLFKIGLWNIIVFCAIAFIVLAFCALVAVSVGTTAECFGYSLAVCGALSVLGLITNNFCNYLFGFAYFEPFAKYCFKLSPFGLIYTYFSEDKSLALTISAWMVLAVVALFSANFIYKHRKSEFADVAGRRNPLSIIIRFIGAFCGGIILFIIFDINSNMPFVACAIGGFLGYIIVDVIFSKGFSTLKKSILFGVSAGLVMCIYGLYFQCGGFGFEKKLPELSDIDNIEITQVGIYEFPSYTEFQDKVYGELPQQYTLSETESKEAVRNIHKLIIDNHFSNTNNTQSVSNGFLSGGDFKITYKLQNGRKVSRYYYLYHNSEIQKAVSKLYDIDEVKKAGTFVFHATPDIIENVSIKNKLGSHTEKLHLSSADIGILIEALQKDILDKSYTNREDNISRDYGTLDFSIINKNAENIENRLISRSIIISEDDVNTVNLLKELGVFGAFSKGNDEISSLTLFSDNNFYRKHLIQASENVEKYNNEYTPHHSIIIEDKDVINTIIQNSELYYISSDDMEKSSVPFTVTLGNGYSYCSNIRIKNIPLSVFEDGRKYYHPKDEDIDALIDVMTKTKEYSSNLRYIIDMYNDYGKNQNHAYPIAQSNETVVSDYAFADKVPMTVEDDELMYSTPAVYLYYLKNTIK